MGCKAVCFAGFQQVLVLVFFSLSSINKVRLKANGQFYKHQDPLGVTPQHQVWMQVSGGCSRGEAVVSVLEIGCDLIAQWTLTLEGVEDDLWNAVVSFVILSMQFQSCLTVVQDMKQ